MLKELFEQETIKISSVTCDIWQLLIGGGLVTTQSIVMRLKGGWRAGRVVSLG